MAAFTLLPWLLIRREHVVDFLASLQTLLKAAIFLYFISDLSEVGAMEIMWTNIHQFTDRKEKDEMCARIEFASVIAIPLPFNGREAKIPFTTYTVQRQTKEVASRFREAFKALLSIQRIVPVMFRRSSRGFDRPCAHRSWWHEMCILLMNVLKCYLECFCNMRCAQPFCRWQLWLGKISSSLVRGNPWTMRSNYGALRWHTDLEENPRLHVLCQPWILNSPIEAPQSH